MIRLAFIFLCLTGLFSHLAHAQECKSGLDTEVLCMDNYFDMAKWDFQNPAVSKWVKFSVDVSPTGQLGILRFQNTQTHFYHYEYLTKRPEFSGLTTQQMDAITLKRPGRRILMGTLIFRKEGEGFQEPADFELISQDSLRVDEVLEIQNRIKANVKDLITQLRYSPVPALREETKAKAAQFQAAGISLALEAPAQKRICYAFGWTVGRVRKMTLEQAESLASQGLISPDDFLVLDKTPRDLPPVAGVVVALQSSPSSHIALLAKMYGFPFFYEGGSDTAKEWIQRDGKMIFLKAQGDTGYCDVEVVEPESLTDQEAAQFLALRRPRPLQQPSLDLAPTAVLPVGSIKLEQVSSYGGKAVHYGLLARTIPEAVEAQAGAIPLSQFARFLDEGKTQAGESVRGRVNRTLEKIAPPTTSLALIVSEISALQKEMGLSQVAPAQVQQIREALTKIVGDPMRRIKLRSSSNVEDIKGFNGAGLYDSHGACLADVSLAATESQCRKGKAPERLEEVLPKVWASLYTVRGYLARRWFGVTESRAAMAILANPSFKGELANGVSIFSKTNQEELQSMITGFPGGDLEVTHPPDGKVPETTRVTQSSGVDQVQIQRVVGTTELPQGQSILNSSEYEALHRLMSKIYQVWPGTPSEKRTLILDFEWKLMPDGVAPTGRKIFLKQVREVPAQAPSKSEELTQSYVVGERSLKLSQTQMERDDALNALQFNVDIDAAISAFRLSDIQAGKNPLESATLRGRLGNYSIQGNQSQSKISVSPWRVYNPDAEIKVESRQVKVVLTLPNPELPSLAMLVTWSEERTVGNKNINDPIVTLARREFSLVTHPRDLVAHIKNPPVDFEGKPVTEVIWGFFNERLQGPTQPYLDKAFEYKGKKIRVSIEAATNNNGVDKTMFLRLKKIVVTGLINKPIVLSGSQFMKYSPAHHNFSWEYALDLFGGVGLTQQDLNLLVKAGGRYLVFGKGPSFSLWSENGLAKVVDEYVP